MEKTVHTFCRICVAACGLEVKVDEAANRVLSIEPDRDNEYTWRDFCRKGKTANEIVEHPRRITKPMRRVGDRYVEATYAEAIADIAARLNAIIERDGPEAVGSYHGNPMGFTFATTTYWTGLLDAIGTNNRYWVGSIDQNNGHVVAEEMYGSELISFVPDIDSCDCFLLIGMDPAVSKFNWMENNPNGWERVRQRQREGADVIVVDPRRSTSAAQAGTHVAILPGQDWALLLGLIKVILDERLEHPSKHLPLDGADRIREYAAAADLGDLSQRCGVDVETIQDIGRRFARARTAMVVTHTGVAHNEHGTLGEWLGHVLALLCDRVDVPGGRRFERGLVPIDKVMSLFAPSTKHRSRLRDLPTIVGFHALAELPDEITTPGAGQIKAMLIAFGNPVVSGPDGAAMDAALSELDLVVAVDLVQRESHRHADWLIPGTHWLEREEVNPLFPSLQDKPYVHHAARVLDKPGGVMEEWELFTELALAMDRNLFGRPGVNRLVRASRAVARATRRPQLAMNPEWVQRLLVAMGRRVKWRDIVSRPHGYRYAEPRYGDLPGLLATPNKRVQLAPDKFYGVARAALDEPAARDAEFPLLLVNKRVREAMNSWLNDSPGLFRVKRDMELELHPDDAAQLGVFQGARVRVTSATGSVELTATLTDAMRRGVVCAPHGWGGRTFDPAGSGAPERLGVNRNLLVGNGRIDPLSQTPAFNSTGVRVEVVGQAAAAQERTPARV